MSAESITSSSNASNFITPFIPQNNLEDHQGYKALVDRVKKCLIGKDQDTSLKELKEVAYGVFGGTHFVKRDQSHNYRVLWMLFFTENPSPEDVASVLLRTYEDFIKSKEDEVGSSSARVFHVYKDSEEMVPVSHGGGVRFFETFRKGQHQGYANEAGGKGLFVTIQKANNAATYRGRDMLYATRTPLLNFDDPFTIQGMIPAKYLHRVNHNSYEAVIFAENIGSLKITKESVVSSIFDVSFSERKKMVEAILPPSSSFSNIDLESTLFDHIKDQYSPEELSRIRDLIYALYL